MLLPSERNSPVLVTLVHTVFITFPSKGYWKYCLWCCRPCWDNWLVCYPVRKMRQGVTIPCLVIQPLNATDIWIKYDRSLSERIKMTWTKEGVSPLLTFLFLVLFLCSEDNARNMLQLRSNTSNGFMMTTGARPSSILVCQRSPWARKQCMQRFTSSVFRCCKSGECKNRSPCQESLSSSSSRGRVWSCHAGRTCKRSCVSRWKAEELSKCPQDRCSMMLTIKWIWIV